MQPPFTSEQFFELFRLYNRTVWPMQLVLITVAFVTGALSIASPRFSRFIVVGLAALWVWMALAYHVSFLAALTPAAYLFAALSLTEAGLLVWHGLRTQRLRFAVPRERSAMIVGAVLLVFALLGYPALAYAVGQQYPAVPTFGLPCPTTIFTFGLLTWCARPVPRSVLWIPTAWALIGTVAAIRLGAQEDFTLLPAAALALAVILWPQVQRKLTATKAESAIQLWF